MAQRFKAKTLISNSGVFNNEVIAPNLVYNTGTQIISGTKIFAGSLGLGDINNPDSNKLYFYDTGTASYNTIQTYSDNGANYTIFQLSNQGPTSKISIDLVSKTISGADNSAINFSNRPTVNGTGVLLSGDIPYVQTNSYFYVDATRTDSYIENGNILYPYKTLSSAYNAAKNIASFHNPTYITLLSPIAENLTIDKGYINLVGNNTNKNDPIRITGSLVFAAAGIGSTITDNNFSIAGLGITATSNNKCILFSGNNPQRLFIQDCWLIAKDNGTCLYSNNTNTTSRLQGDILKLSPEGVNATAIDIVSGTSSISFAETSSSASVLAYVRNNSTLNISNSQIETTGVKAFQVENTARLTLLNSVLTNTANPSTGIFLKDAFSTAVVVGSAISVPANANSYAINGVANSYLFYKNLYFSIDAIGGSTESKIGNNVNKNLINSYDPVVYSIGDQTISGVKTFSDDLNISGDLTLNGGLYINDIEELNLIGANIYADNIVYNTGNQTISGVKTFANNLQVSGTGIFNALDLNNIDNLSLSGVDITITSGVVSLTNPLSAPNLVYNIGNQNIIGNKSFYGDILLSGTNNRIGKYHYINTDSDFVYIRDQDNNIILSTEEYTLFDSTEVQSVSWGARIVTDSVGRYALNWNNRNLINQNGNEVLYWTGDNIGIGTNNPTEKLQVIGNILGNNLVYNTGNQTISGVKTFANGSNQILNTTYSTLTGLKATSGLLSGQLYRISDFVLKWNNQSINDQTVKTAVSGEPLIVTALSNNKIYHIAQSETYPQDTIYYNIDASTSYSWGTINNNVAIPDFKGWIYRRVDNLLNIDIPYDWRNITVNCCKPDVSSVPNYSGNYQYTRLDYVKETGNNSNRGKLYYSVVTGNSGNGLNNSNFWSPISDYVESGTYFATRENINFTALYAYDEDAEENVPIINLPFIPSSRIQQPVFTSTFTDLGVFKLSNVYNIKINGGHNSVFLGESVYNNNIGDNFYSNSIGANTYGNNIGDNFYQNILSNGNAFNDIGDNCFQNIGMGNFSYNKIDHDFYYNTIGNSFYSNDIKSYFVTNIIGFNFDYNSIDQFFSNNLIAHSFYYNTIGKNFFSNTIGSNFTYNNIGHDFYYNTIGNGFFGNTAEGGFNDVDFSTSTHVYNSYNITLFRNSANSMRLRYFNSSDQLVVTDPTA